MAERVIGAIRYHYCALRRQIPSVLLAARLYGWLRPSTSISSATFLRRSAALPLAMA
jgi:hypothetical protein